MVSISRQTGATMCAMARCPNKLGATPYRYCLDHLPADYRKRVERYLRQGDVRKGRFNPCHNFRGQARKLILDLVSERGQVDRSFIREATDKFSENAVDKAILDLIATGEIKRVKVGVYRCPK